jgi:hypothetical protein
MVRLQAIQDVGPENLQKKAAFFRSKTVTADANADAALNYSQEADSTAKMAAATANELMELIQAYRPEMRDI